MKYHLVTLGCPKNKVDSDGIEMQLRSAHYRPTDRRQEADVLIVNTCGFLEAAKEESIAVLQELSRRKRRDQLLIAAGCLVQRASSEVVDRVPKVDGLLGTRRWMEVLDLLSQLRAGQQRRRLERYPMLGDTALAGAELAQQIGERGVPALRHVPQSTLAALISKFPMAATPPARSARFLLSKASCAADRWQLS